MFETAVLLEKQENIAVLTINRPKALNALNSEVYRALTEAVAAVREDAEVRCVVLIGSGDKAFAAGSDIKAMSEMNVVQARALVQYVHQMQNQIESLGKPVIAAINGLALGGGLELALSCDLRILADNAKVGLPEVGLGIIPGSGGTQRLARLIGKGRAMYYLLTCDMMDAQTAFDLGLATKVVPQEEVFPTAVALAKKIARQPALSVTLAKNSLNTGADMDLNSALKLETEAFLVAFGTEDKKEGMAAFMEKRKPQYIGR